MNFPSTRDPLRPSPLDDGAIDALWMHAAGQLGFTVTRTQAAYATSDGRGGIGVGTRQSLDVDDCVAQLVLHELCHALVEGEPGLALVDWGLDNTSDRDVDREYASLRLQAHFADAQGLRLQMAPTTEWRPYYDILPENPLAGSDEAAHLANQALRTALFRSWAPLISKAMEHTRLRLQALGARVVVHSEFTIARSARA